MAALRFKLLIPLFFLLQACAQQSWVTSMTTVGCVPDAQKRVSEADWSNPGKLSVRIRQGEFTPMVFGLTNNRPYEIEFENADDVPHTFQAADFFRSVAFDKIRVDGEEVKKICPRSLVIAPGKKLTAYLIPVRDGRYEFSDNTFDLPLGALAGVSGSISIEEKRVALIRPPKSIPPYPEGILEFLKAPVRAPVESGPGPQPGGLFDDTQQSPPAEPGGLFDDQEQSPPAEPGGLFNDVEDTSSPAPAPEAAPVAPIDEMFADPLKEESQQPASPPVFDEPAQGPQKEEPPAPVSAPIPVVPKPEAPKIEAKKVPAFDLNPPPTLPRLEDLLKDEPAMPLFPEDKSSDAPLSPLRKILGAESNGVAHDRKNGRKKGKVTGSLKAIPPKPSVPPLSVTPVVKPPAAAPEKPKEKAAPKEKEKTQKEQQTDPFGDDLFKLPDDKIDGGGSGTDDNLLEDSLRYVPYLGLGGMNRG